MSFRRMTRMISFRVSEQEFEQLRDKSEALGARSISDYARIAICASPNQPKVQSLSEIHDLKDGIQRLSLDVRRLFALLEHPHETFLVQPESSKPNDEIGSA